MYESKVFVTMVLILIFGEVLGLYGYVTLILLNMPTLIHAFQTNRRAHHEFDGHRGWSVYILIILTPTSYHDIQNTLH